MASQLQKKMEELKEERKPKKFKDVGDCIDH
jgi:hypothetical protein